MKVVICEDDSLHRHLIYTELKNYSMFHNPSIEIVLETANPEEVLAYVAEHPVDCYFLDIDLSHELTGMDVAYEIRKDNPLASIIFVTTDAEKWQLVFKYQLEALDYIVKDTQEKMAVQLQKVIRAAFEKYQKLGQQEQANVYQLKVDKRIVNIPYDDIYFFTTSIQVHKIELYAKNHYYEFYGSMQELEKVDERFYRCHTSYVINLQHVVEVNAKERTVTMVDESVCKVSFRAMRTLRKKIGTN
ncbi:LytTR family DNA-binding domain-containing protein [Metasolibacillus meyeri]|uniref:LytTR family DNA-binding domain-containing protein n=1 Tax=Metasolibacillus meyeri TaxID=1071052 RepID=A0AAW9NLQ1_9BACL|nr:LytTR family DNA-binding domain-containing protein [Metasolibacillus meyeri]MEC1178562.1 LytTR family DNA-binding domain-containing protein [Metasolibacillus meyeri]